MRALLFATILITSLPLFSADFSGRILTNKAVPVSGAKIIIFNEFSIALVQRVFTDRSGSFRVTLPPGSYFVWVVREGYAPYFERISIPSGDTTYTASWLLHPKKQGNGDEAPSLKHILRHAGGGTHREAEKK